MLVSEVLFIMYIAGSLACFLNLYRENRFQVLLPGLAPDDWLSVLATFLARASVSTYWLVFMLIETVHHKRIGK